MHTTILQQPFDAAGNPQTLGTALTAEAGAYAYARMRVAVAFATSSGTSRLFGVVQNIVAAGGQADVYIGVNNGITTAQAAEHLLLAGASVWAFNTGGSVLFHPKIYWFEGPARSWVSAGSSNLTSDGLYRNFEANSLTVFDPGLGVDALELGRLLAWFASLNGYAGHCVQLDLPALPALVASGELIDERAAPSPQVLPRRRAPAGTPGPRIRVPGAPPPHPNAPGARTRFVRRAARPPVLQAGNAQYFAMTLSAFDCSHRTGVPGTPEVALPDTVVPFFPPVGMHGRKYPDAYFDVALNDPGGIASVVTYRIWQRPPGSAVGHADWRINVGHGTIDQTTPGGGDILLFERLPPNSSPAYEVWTVPPGDPRYPALLARCTQQVAAAGAAGVKQYGLF